MTVRSLLRSLLLGGALLLVGLGLTVAIASQINLRSIETNQVGVAGDGGGAPLFDVRKMAASQTEARCLRLTSQGKGSSTLRLWGITGGTGFDRYLRLRIERGQVPPAAFGSCAGFAPDGASSTIYDGTLRDFPDGAAQAFSDAEPFAPVSTRAYRFTVISDSNPAQQGLWASQDFRICARPIGLSGDGCFPYNPDDWQAAPPAPPTGGAGPPSCTTIISKVAGPTFRGKRVTKWRRLAPQPARPGRPILKARMVTYVRGPVGDRRIIARLSAQYGKAIRKKYRIRAVTYFVNGKRTGRVQRAYPYRVRIPSKLLRVGKNNIRARVDIGGPGVKPRTIYWGFKLGAVKKGSSTGCVINQ